MTAWLVKLISRICSRSSIPTIAPEPSTTPGANRMTPPPAAPSAMPLRIPVRGKYSDAAIASALQRGGLANSRPSDVAFVRKALEGVDWPKGIDLRRHGTRVAKDRLKALNYRSNLIITAECLAILTEEGLKDPVFSAQSVVSALERGRTFARKTAQTRGIFGEAAMIQVTANNMASGPCSACIALAAKPIPLSMAPNGPLPECPHPDQCVLHWRSHYVFDE